MIPVLAFLFWGTKAVAQNADSAAQKLAPYICNCIDTLDMNRPETELEVAVNRCKILGVLEVLNEPLSTSVWLHDVNLVRKVDRAIFNILMRDCAAMQRLAKVMLREPEPAETCDPKLFIPETALSKYHLFPGERSECVRIYNYPNLNNGDPVFQRLVDVRWVFKTNADALRWHEAQMKTNSEDGVPVTQKIVVPGAQDLHVFRESLGVTQFMRDYKLKQRFHYFIFVYKNVVCKVFVATNDKTQTAQTVLFANAAIKQLKAAVK